MSGSSVSGSSGALGRPHAFQTIFLGGSIAGVLDGLDAVTFYGLAYAVSPAHLFKASLAGSSSLERFREAGLPLY